MSHDLILLTCLVSSSFGGKGLAVDCWMKGVKGIHLHHILDDAVVQKIFEPNDILKKTTMASQ